MQDLRLGVRVRAGAESEARKSAVETLGQSSAIAVCACWLNMLINKEQVTRDQNVRGEARVEKVDDVMCYGVRERREF